MRSFRPILGANVAECRIFFGRFPMNGNAAPAAWTQGGKGMAVPTYGATGTYTIVLADAPGGVLVNWDATSRADVIGNNMNTFGGTWNSTTNTFTFFCTTLSAPTVLADPPAAATDREFTLTLVFSNQSNT